MSAYLTPIADSDGLTPEQYRARMQKNALALIEFQEKLRSEPTHSIAVERKAIEYRRRDRAFWREIQCVETGAIYASCEEAAAAIKKCRSSVFGSIRTGQAAGVFHFARRNSEAVFVAVAPRPKQKKPVLIGGVRFESMSDAATAYKTTCMQVWRWLEVGWVTRPGPMILAKRISPE